MVATVAVVAIALQLCLVVPNEAKPLKKNTQNSPSSFFNDADQAEDQTGDANNKFEFMNEAELSLGALDKANSDIDEQQNRNDDGESSANDDDGESSYERPEVAASHHKKAQRHNGMAEESSPKGNSDQSDNGPINEFAGNDREEHDKNMNSDISEAVGGGQGESASASDESADQADENPIDETSNVDDDESSGSPVPVEHPRARAASAPVSRRPLSASRSIGFGLESRPSTLTNKKMQQNSSKRQQQVQELSNINNDNNDDGSDIDNEQRDPMSRIVDRGEQDSADSKAMYTTTTDLKAAASGEFADWLIRWSDDQMISQLVD